MLAFLKPLGTTPLCRDRLKMRVNEGAKTEANDVYRKGKMPSGPGAFSGFKRESIEQTDSIVTSANAHK